MDDAQVWEDGPQRIRRLMRETFADQFKEYFLGQPEEIGLHQLPCIMVTELEGLIETGSSHVDEVTETIQIILAVNKLDDLNASSDTDLTERKLQQFIKGQDPTTGRYLTNTVAYALRKNITLNEGVISSRLETNFDIQVRGDNVYTQEAYVKVYVKRNVIVDARS